MDKFGDKIVELRKNAELSQSQLAEAVGVSQATISRLEGMAVFTGDFGLAAKIARHFKIPLSDLLPSLQNPLDETFFAFCPNPFCSENEVAYRSKRQSEDTSMNDEIAGPSTPAGKYTEHSVQIYKDAAHIRQRPGMYIGNTSTAGLHHLVYELVYNSVDEALAGYCKSIHVKINVDGSLSVADDGRGIPVEEHPEAKKPTLEVLMTTVGAGAKFDKNTYKVSAGLHGIGAKAVTALSEWVEAEVRRNGQVYVQEYERGKATTGVTERGTSKRTGTTITFKPDREIFKDAIFDYDTLEVRLRELAFLNKGLAIKLTDERPGKEKEESFKYDGGISQFAEYRKITLDGKLLFPNHSVSWNSYKQYQSKMFDETNFCPTCGTPLCKECPSCQRNFDKSFTAFCIRCGTRVTDRPTEKEWEKIRKNL